MNYKLILTFVVILTFYLYPQKDLTNDSKSNDEKERILRSYLTGGVGLTGNHQNFGAGLFFPLGKNILIGPRVNADFEIDVFSKSPAENIWNINLTIKYIPLISKRFIFYAGIGAGYSMATKRGEFIRNILITAEYEKVYSSSISLLGEIEAGFLITDNIGVNLIGYTLYADNKTFLKYQLGIFLCKILEL